MHQRDAGTWNRLGRLWRRILSSYRRRFAASRIATSPGMSEAELTAALRSTSPRKRWQAAAALGKSALRSSEAIAALASALADPEPFVRWQAAGALAVQNAGTVFPVLRSLLSDPDPLRRTGGAEALGRMGGEAACVALREPLADPVPPVRAAAARALGLCGDSAAAKALAPLLDDADVEVRCAAAHGIGQIGDPGMACALADTLARPGNPLLARRALAAALARIPHPETQPVLLQALGDPDAQVRGYAAEALGQVGNEEACAPLAAALPDPTPVIHSTVGESAARALALLERRGRRAPTVQLQNGNGSEGS